jgi:hypothetical protein
MKTLKNIKVIISPLAITAGFQDEQEFKTQQSECNIADVLEIVESRLHEGEELKEFLCQITEDQHLSEERILYRMIDDSYRFLAVSNMTVAEQELYTNYKNEVSTAINL